MGESLAKTSVFSIVVNHMEFGWIAEKGRDSTVTFDLTTFGIFLRLAVYVMFTPFAEVLVPVEM